MTEQPRLLPRSFHLDAVSRDAGRRGLVKAREALADAHRRNAQRDHPAERTDHPHRPHAAAA